MRRLGNKGLIASDRRKIISCIEKNRTFRLKNSAKKLAEQYRVDGGIISDPNRRKCDFAIDFPVEEITFLIELKGRHLKDAAEQLYATILYLQTVLTLARLEARAVLSRTPVPDIASSDVIRLKRLLKSYDGQFIYKTSLIEESFT